MSRAILDLDVLVRVAPGDSPQDTIIVEVEEEMFALTIEAT